MEEVDNLNKGLYKNALPDEIKIVDIPGACKRYGRGRAGVMRDASDAGAVIRIGRTVRINISILDRYYDSISGE